MTNSQAHPTTLASHLSGPIIVGDPDLSGSLAVYPLFGPPCKVDFHAFRTALEQTDINELEEGASVNDLVVVNKSAKPVLLYEGEEVLGAQQNRVLDISVLVGIGKRAVVPVSCVEQGRWDGSKRHERFRPSPQAADPDLRRKKSEMARRMVAAGGEARANQGEVWNEVSYRAEELAAPSATGAMSDVFDGRRESLDLLRGPIKLHDGQCGAVVAIGGKIRVLDFVGRDDVWSELQPALLQGYALDALRAGLTTGQDRSTRYPDPPDLSTVRGFTLMATDASVDGAAPGPGLGVTVRFEADGVGGSGLIHSGELIQLSAYPANA